MGDPSSPGQREGKEGVRQVFWEKSPCPATGGLRVRMDSEGLAWVTPTQSCSEWTDGPGPAQWPVAICGHPVLELSGPI